MTSYRQEKEERPLEFICAEATTTLRWCERRDYETNEYGDVFGYKIKKVLQQLWRDRYNGKEEWRDVPTD